MPVPSENASHVQSSIDANDIPTLIQDLRYSFGTDKTRTKGWRVSQLNALVRLLTEGADELCDAMYKDVHKDSFDCLIQEIELVRCEAYDALKHLDEWMADESVPTNVGNLPGESVIKKDPLGVVMIIGAWNFNVLLTLNPLVGAIAAGNCAILKPGSYAEHSSIVIANLIAKYMDQECIRCVTGDRRISQALLEQRFDKIFFTGSPFVGKVVAKAAANFLTPVVLELGGKSPCIVDNTVDITVAAKRYTWGALLNCGQVCTRPDYVMVHQDVADQFINEVINSIREFYGNDAKSSRWFGRIINDNAFNRLTDCIQKDNEYIVYGGDSDAGERFVAPTIFDFGNNMAAFEQSSLMQDEIFGPLLPIFRYDDIDTEVLPFIRARPKPLALYVFTKVKSLGERVLSFTSSGGAMVNDVVTHLTNPNLPFGGVGDSGVGSYHGKKSFLTFSHEKSVLRRGTFMDVQERYPPYTDYKQRVLSIAVNPQVNHYTDKANKLFGNKKNIALGIMGAYIMRQAFMSKL